MHRVRIATGIALFTFAATHLLNHALGLVSIEAMEEARGYRTAITRSWPVSVVLAASLLIHLILGLRSFARRRVLQMRPAEAFQLAFGILIPLFLFKHIIGMRFSHELYGVNDNYAYALFVIWPSNAINQLVLITLVWVHGCIGMHAWLHMRPWYRRLLPAIFGAAVLIPVLAFAGFAVAGREIRNVQEFTSPFTSEQFASLLWLMDVAFWGYLALIAAFVVFHLVRFVTNRFLPKVRVTYPGGLVASVTPGATVLEVSRLHGVPHASVCGGRARCSTCRIRVLEGLDNQPEASQTERHVLERVGATHNVRLACQLRPTADIAIVPLLPAHRTGADDVHKLDKYFWGVEHTVTLMFTDIRGFTALTETQLPYDVVFLLNQYLGRMSDTIIDTGGYVDKFMGDGIMAIFGMDKPAGEGARDAILAARAMAGVLGALNQSLRTHISEPVRIGIGIHTGDAILGRIGVSSGSGAGERITALGDTVNTASRLEAACKDLGVQLVVSAETLEAAGLPRSKKFTQQISVRGKSETLAVAALPSAMDLEIANS
ncbi:MAG: 2Fe-2S iron-sulfur cluster binding domain-containing protein [Rhizobiales bacterium]|nr:2Fe-2S iron-sulfur cluster binding domain-containing protein [Hyphomicrobiales bacterium]